MAAFKNDSKGTWYVMFRYNDWKGERKQKYKRWVCHSERGACMGEGFPPAETS